MISLTLFVLALFLFFLGLFQCLTEKRFLGFLIGIELILNGAALNFASFYWMQNQRMDMMVGLLFVISFAVIETVVGLAIFTWAAKIQKSQPQISLL